MTTTRRSADETFGKGRSKSDSDPSTARSSPVEVRRKLSLLEEKRAIFQRRFFDSSKSTLHARSDDTTIDVGTSDRSLNIITGDNYPPPLERREEERTGKTRHISVRTYDTFSTFEGTLDEEELAYLAGDIEETENYDDSDYAGFHAAMASIVGATDHPEKVEVTLPFYVSMLRKIEYRRRFWIANAKA